MAVKQTAGRDALGEFAPEFAHLNDILLARLDSFIQPRPAIDQRKDYKLEDDEQQERPSAQAH